MQEPTPIRQIRALFTEKTIRVYQAYSKQIAQPALQSGKFVSPPFKMERMTWIKPSFFWMMYRSGYGQKPNQETVLGIDITREGFEWALANSCLSHYSETLHASVEEWERQKEKSPVRIQWDPERNIKLEKLNHRSIQIGLSGEAVHKYVNQWITGLEDCTESAHTIFQNRFRPQEEVQPLLPEERVYPLPEAIGRRLGMY